MVESDSELGWVSAAFWFGRAYSGFDSGRRDSDAVGGSDTLRRDWKSRAGTTKSTYVDSGFARRNGFMVVRWVDDSFSMLFTASEWEPGELSIINYQLSIING